MSIIDKVKQLISIMNENELSEIEIQEDVTKIRIKKSDSGDIRAIPSISAPAALPIRVESGQEACAAPKEIGNFVEIVSPMVGTFYRASAPGADPCGDVGGTISEGTRSG